MKKLLIITSIFVAGFLIAIGFFLGFNYRKNYNSKFSDTDNGKNYFFKGYTTGYRAFWEKTSQNIVKEQDSCTLICEGSVGSGISTNGPCLIEFYLDENNYAAFDVIKCEKGCMEGACIK